MQPFSSMANGSRLLPLGPQSHQTGTHDILPRSSIPARHRAEKRRRPAAAHGRGHAWFRCQGTQCTLGTFSPPLRRRLRREDFRRAVAGCRVFRGAARAPLRVSLARPARPFLCRTGRINKADGSDYRNRRWRHGDVSARQDLWRAVWDKVLAFGSTDPLSGDVAHWATVVLTAYFGGRSIEKVARILTRK